jgi:hypothetical protein
MLERRGHIGYVASTVGTRCLWGNGEMISLCRGEPDQMLTHSGVQKSRLGCVRCKKRKVKVRVCTASERRACRYE